MSEELKACPDGGALCLVAIATVRRPKDMTPIGFRAVCYECQDRGPLRPSPEQAITAWNTRAGEEA